MNDHPSSDELAFGLLVTVKERNLHLKPLGRGWVGGALPLWTGPSPSSTATIIRPEMSGLEL